MDKDKYIDMIENKLKRNFLIGRNTYEDGEFFDLTGKFHDVSGRIFITKVDIIDKYETFENCYLRYMPQAGFEDIQKYFELMVQKADTLNPQKDHFYTDVTGILIADKLPDDLMPYLKKLKFQRYFRMFWRGFSTVRLVCTELSTGRVSTNRAGREIKKVYEF